MDPNVIAMLQALASSGQYSPLPEYSASRGFLPMDSGTMGANINQLQDVAGVSGQGLAVNPLVLAALGYMNGDMFQMGTEVVEPANKAGETLLLQVIQNTPQDSWQNLVATGLYEGMTPELAVENALSMMPEGSMDLLEEDDALAKANEWFDKLMMDTPEVTQEKPGEGLAMLRKLGIPDPGTGLELTSLNSRLEPAVDAYTSAKDAAAKADDKVLMKPAAGGGSSSSRHSQRVRQRTGETPQKSAASRIQYLDPNASAKDVKERRNSIAARDTASRNVLREGAFAQALQDRLVGLGVDPTQLAARQRLAQIQQLAGGGF